MVENTHNPLFTRGVALQRMRLQKMWVMDRVLNLRQVIIRFNIYFPQINTAVIGFFAYNSRILSFTYSLLFSATITNGHSTFGLFNKRLFIV